MKNALAVAFMIMFSLSLTGCDSNYQEGWIESLLEVQDNSTYENTYSDGDNGYIETDFSFTESKFKDNPILIDKDSNVIVYFDNISTNKDYITDSFSKDDSINEILGEQQSKNTSEYTIEFLNDLMTKGYIVERAGLRDGTRGYLASPNSEGENNTFLSKVDDRQPYFFVTDENKLIAVFGDNEEEILKLIRNYYQ